MFRVLQWKPDRVEHIAKHGLSPEEVEEATFADPGRRLFRGPRSESDQTRSIYYLYGRTQAGRYLLVVLLDQGEGRALPVTARDMTQKERQRYGG
ncbi:MAG: BrnT family toxin [Chloroflexi bacterium]|nr:BrnT family toxin [Chloroflexota bacterium]